MTVIGETVAAAREHDPLLRADIAQHAAAALGGPAPAELVDELTEITGGIPWLVHRALELLRQEGRRALSGSVLSRATVAQLRRELGDVGGDLRELLLALAVGFDLSDTLPPAIEQQSGPGVDTLVAKAQAEGLLLPNGTVIPLLRETLLETTPTYRVRALQRTLVDTLTIEHRSLSDVARSLARSGLHDHRIASALETAGDRQLATQPTLAWALYDEAAAAGADPLATAAKRAQAASATGSLDGAARILDDLLSHDDPPDIARAVDVGASIWARRGMLARSTDLYRWLGAARVGSSAGLAAVAMLGTGDKDAAGAMLNGAPATGSPSLASVAVTSMGQGALDSVEGRTSRALTTLIRASDLMTASRVAGPVPETPAALAAVVALHNGELDVADSVIDSALRGGQGGQASRSRLLLLQAWTAMQGDRPDRARKAITRATAGTDGLAPRDDLMLSALEVGLARRADDLPGLVRAWKIARESILHVSTDLYNLLPLGELLTTSARLRDRARVESHLADAWSLLKRLGDPPLWSIPLHWAAVQAAILAEKPSELIPHAAALAHAANENHSAAVLAAAGKAWVSVLAGDFDVPAVEEAARGLATVGRTWEGSRLAGHAAARVDERRDVAHLLACARELHPGFAAPDVPEHPASPAGARSGTARDEAGLSAREREVAGLLLEGKTYSEIGEAIFISPRTVEHHVARIRRRLGVTTRSELLAQLRIALDPHAESPPTPYSPMPRDHRQG
ncbi:helix-turn-helix transcriptional regulator [Salinibacterium sp. ZJ454]|uniref:helix-turn-helix transcriptional regulator n=1 Tax=Salinibacterium sp. ZJ454 TaxID=2708339 RepID=UPI00141E0720|nr:helix-turn-helix transcriptional regulator [Salinibacterium sp. ZJ454]